MAEVLNADLAAGNPKAVQVRIAMQSATRAGGQRNHDLRLGAQPEYVAEERTDQNRVLIEPQTGTRLRKTCEERRAQRKTARAMKSNASVATAGIITFGHEAQPIFERLDATQQDAAYREVAQRIAEFLNTGLTGLVVHADESAPHAHFQLPAFDRAGMPISATAKRGAMKELQNIAAEVMGRHAPGIERGHSKKMRLKNGAKPSEVINKSVAELHDELPAELAALKAKIDAAAAKARTNEERAKKAKAKLERLLKDEKATAERIEKARKNADIYEDRAKKARAAEERLAGLETRIDAAEARKALAEADAREAEDTLAQKKTKKQNLSATLNDLNATLSALTA